MTNVKVSVVTVCFNSVKTIEQTIQSIVGQSYENIEYIIIDGGSTDGTLDIIKKYEKDIDYWVSGPDHGTYDAMNKGIAKATGDIIGFMNSDDWYVDGAIRVVAETFSKTDADIVYGKTVIVENETRRLRDDSPLENIFAGMVFCHQSVFVKTSLMKCNPFDISYRIVADYVFFLEMYLQGKKFCQIDSTIAFFRAGGNSYHPWKTYMETKRAVLRVSRGRVSAKRYKGIWEYFKERKTFPVVNFLKKRMEDMPKEKKEAVFVSLREKEVVLYGAGKLGNMVLNSIKTFGLNVKNFWVSESLGHNKKIDGVPVLSPVPKSQQKNEIIILITTTKYHEEVAEHLLSFGYRRKRDFFDVDDWLRWLGYIWICSISDLRSGKSLMRKK